MKSAKIADGVREGMQRVTGYTQAEFDRQILRHEIVKVLYEVLSDPDDYDYAKVADDLISKVRACLIEEDAELPRNPYEYGQERLITLLDSSLHAAKALSYLKAQEDMKAAGWRKVKEARE